MNNTGSRRVMRYEKEVRQLTSSFLISRINEPHIGLASVTRVIVSGDLRSAKVFINFLQSESPADDIKTVERYLPDLQSYIHRSLRSKFCPKIKLILDESYEQFLKVERLLHEIDQERSSQTIEAPEQ